LIDTKFDPLFFLIKRYLGRQFAYMHVLYLLCVKSARVTSVDEWRGGGGMGLTVLPADPLHQSLREPGQASPTREKIFTTGGYTKREFYC